MSATISLNVVVRNEEARIEACLRDARPWVDEIVVVDQSSTDRTVELARALADVVVSDPAYGYCEASRKRAAENSRGEWILVLDADEVLSDECKSQLRGLTTRGRDGFRLMREFYLDGALEWRGDKHYRFFRNDRVRFLSEIHTEPQPTTTNIEELQFTCIVHHKSMAEQLADEERYEEVIRRAPLSDERRHAKLKLNVHLAKARATGSRR